jgi:hypothetical protein
VCSRLVPATLLLLALTATASAQEQIRGDLFAGYSFANADLGAGSKVGLHGYEVSSEFNPLPWLGITIDNDGHFGSASVPFCFGGAANTCTTSGPRQFSHLDIISGGPRFTVPKGRFMPFARALFGLATLNACPVQGCESEGTFAQAYGGGIDVRVSQRRVGWRFQGDFLQTRFFGRRQADARFSTGLLIFFYKHSH